ncbi:MAG: apolipoprotein N-acyltransferase [Bacteroidales bacterium]
MSRFTLSSPPKTLKKWQLTIISAITGILLSLAWPLNGFSPILLFAFLPLLYVENYIISNPYSFSKYAAFRYSYLSFLIWNILTTWWIWNSTEIGGVLAILLNSAFMSLTFQVFHFVHKKLYDGSRGIYALIPLWITFEYLHLDWDLSWPWLNLGNGFASFHKWIQWYEYTGTFGGTTWILLSNILIFDLVHSFYNKKASIKSKIITRVITPIVIIVPIVISFVIYYQTEDKGEKASIVVGQPNIDPYKEQYELSVDQSINRNLEVTKPLLNDKTNFLILPESTLQEDIEENQIENSESILRLETLLIKYPKLSILVGASTYKVYKKDEPLTQTARKFPNTDIFYDSYNTALFIQKGEKTQTYHKSKLVPGVEKMPFPKLLSPLQKFAFDLGGTVSSYGINKSRTVFFSEDHKFGLAPAICYESIYGEFMSRYVRNGANIFAIITNDGWWGDTPGHKQHFIYATLRAIENRRSIARSANTGISGFFNQRGDIIEETKYWVPDALQYNVPANTELTFYVKHGDYLGKMFSFISFFMILTTIVKAIIKRQKKTSK